MKKIIVEKEKKLTIDDVVEQLQYGRKLIVFYRTNNDINGLPVFLKKVYDKICFISPINNYKECYIANTFRECLESVSKSRTLYVLEEDEHLELFKVQCDEK